jgi:hypothetical protein
MLGWISRDSVGRRYAHCERIFLRPGSRGVANTLLKFQVHDKWNAQCRRRGVMLTITRIRTDRPKLIDMVKRFGGYREHYADKLLTYLHLRLDSPTQMKQYHQARLNAAVAYEQKGSR